MGERYFWLAFSAFPGVGPVRFALLLSHFGSAKKAWGASTKDLLHINFGEKLTFKFDTFRRSFDVDGYAKRLKDLEIATAILTDEKYPALLKQIPDPPFVLYIKGRPASAGRLPHAANDARQPFKKSSNVNSSTPVKQASSFASLVRSSLSERRPSKIKKTSDIKSGSAFSSFAGGQSSSASRESKWDISKSIAVVGTRKITNYGREVTRFLVAELVNAGLTIVSGLAIGIDAAAHEAALETGGKTIAVLGCGVDCCYPRVNQNLYNKIIDGSGCIMSEMPLGHWALKGLFPARNRIISGLSLGVVVVEGTGDSGALITARLAGEQGREVFAVPGPITSSLSTGPADLIKKGAKLVTNAGDILEELGVKGIGYRVQGRVERTKGTVEEEKILSILEEGELGFDEIVRKIAWPASKVGSILSIMEIKGMIRSLGNSIYAVSS